MDFEPMCPGFESRESHDFFFIYLFFLMFFFLSLLLQCKFANSTLLSLLSFSYFITPYDAQASSAFSALIYLLKLSMQYAFVLIITIIIIGGSTCSNSSMKFNYSAI